MVMSRRGVPDSPPSAPISPDGRNPIATVLMWLSSVGACPVSQWLAERQASPLAPWMFGRICRGGGAQVFEPYDASMLQLAWTMAVAPPRETPADWLLYKGAGEVAKILADQLGSDVRLMHRSLTFDKDPTASLFNGRDSPCLAPQHSVRAGFAATVRPFDATDSDALQREGSGGVSNSVLATAWLLWSLPSFGNTWESGQLCLWKSRRKLQSVQPSRAA